MARQERLGSSDPGTEAARKYVQQFDELLSSRAETYARQRRASLIDDADYNAAFRDLLSSEHHTWRSWLAQVSGSLLMLLGGGTGGYGISHWAESGDHKLIAICGILLGLVGAGLQHFHHIKS